MIQKEIPFGSELHTRIQNAIWQRREMSKRKMSERYEDWERAEKEHVAYIPAAEAERRQKLRAEEASFTQLKIPYTYAMVLAAHTYWTSVFLSRSPIIQVAGRHGEAQQKVLAHEALLDYQATAGKQSRVYQAWLLDTAKYGIGVLGTYWHKEEFVMSEYIEEQVVLDGVPISGKTQTVKRNKVMTGFEGNKVYNVRPFDWYPDPRVPLTHFQEGEFCGRRTRVGFNTILKGERLGRYFNVAVLRREQRTGQRDDYEQNPALVEKERDSLLLPTMKDKDFIDLTEMVIEIIPKDWGLGESPYPEKWAFTLGNDRVIIGAQPLGLPHDKFPFALQENEVDGHGLTSRGFYKIAQPLSSTMDWLINSHMFNVEKTVNNEYIYDPTMISQKDFLDPRPGKRVRMKPAAYGRDARTMVHQLSQVDYTQQHLQDLGVIEGLFQRVFGINDQILGALPTAGRRTATESRQAAGFGVNRLKATAEYFSQTGWMDLTQMFIQNNQELYSDEKVLKIAGSNFQEGDNTIAVTPEQLSGFFDYVPVDGTLPVDRFAQASLWRDIFSSIMQMPPEIGQQYDMAAMFGWFAKLAGATNIDQFKRESPLMTDEAVQRGVQAGNLVPVNEVNNGQAGTSRGEIADDQGIGSASEVAGVGATG